MSVIHTQRYGSPCGELLLGSFDGGLCLCDWTANPKFHHNLEWLATTLQSPVADTPSALTRLAATQLDEYFARQRREFTLPLLIRGTRFQLAVWHALGHVAYGQTRTYAQLAALAGEPRAVRAAGSANGANRLALFLPCHRITRQAPGLGGYTGGMAAKRYLLQLEGSPYSVRPLVPDLVKK